MFPASWHHLINGLRYTKFQFPDEISASLATDLGKDCMNGAKEGAFPADFKFHG